MYPRIKYCGDILQVTPDTAAELIDRGEATLVSGSLEPAPTEPSPEPAPDPDKADGEKETNAPEGKVTNNPKGKKTTSRKGGRKAK